jgi:hypothetical protein
MINTFSLHLVQNSNSTIASLTFINSNWHRCLFCSPRVSRYGLAKFVKTSETTVLLLLRRFSNPSFLTHPQDYYERDVRSAHARIASDCRDAALLLAQGGVNVGPASVASSSGGQSCQMTDVEW